MGAISDWTNQVDFYVPTSQQINQIAQLWSRVIEIVRKNDQSAKAQKFVSQGHCSKVLISLDEARTQSRISVTMLTFTQND